MVTVERNLFHMLLILWTFEVDCTDMMWKQWGRFDDWSVETELRLLHLTGTVVKSSSSIFSSFPQPVSHFLNLTKDGENLVHLDRTVWRALYIVCSFNFDIVVPFFMQFSLLFCYPALYLHISFVFLAAPFRLLRELYAVILYELWFMQYNCLCQSVYRSSSTCFWFCSCHDIENNARACLTITVENNNSAWVAAFVNSLQCCCVLMLVT